MKTTHVEGKKTKKIMLYALSTCIWCKKTKDLLEIELIGENNTLANVVKEELYQDSKVKGAAYVVEHPLTSSPRIIIHTNGENPEKILKNAAARLEKQATEFEQKFKKAK